MEFDKIINHIKNVNKTDIKGKSYTTVATRVEIFRKFFGYDYSINAELLVDDEKRILMKASIINKEGNVIGTGHAEEIRGSGFFPQGDKRNINTTSALENCETSCIGRALSSLSLHGGEYPSVNEIEIAQNKEKKINDKPKFDWNKWVDDQIQKVNQLNSSGLTRWTADEQDNLVELSKVDKGLHLKLFKTYKERKENARST